MPKVTRKLFLVSLLISFFLIFTSLVYINRNYFLKLKILAPIQRALQTEYKFGKVTVSKSELDEAIKLEKEIKQNEIVSQSATQSAKAKVLSDTNIESAARERVIKRKILEAEAAKLGINLKEIAGASSDYDSLLSKAAKEKVEGYYLVRVIDISPKLKSDSKGFMGMAAVSPAQKSEVAATSQKLKNELEAGQDINSEVLQTAESSGLVVLSRNIALSKNDTAEGDLVDVAKFAGRSPVGKVELITYGYSARVVELLRQNEGLGQSFDDWYASVKSRYL